MNFVEHLTDPRFIVAVLSVLACAIVVIVIVFRPRKFKIFINYRKDDTDDLAYRNDRDTSIEARTITDALREQLGDEHMKNKDRTGPVRDGQVFLDRDDIDGGSDWRDFIKTEHHQSSVLVCLIGKQWHTLQQDGNPRLHHPTDVLREELEAAFKQGMEVIPVLVNGGEVKYEGLPESLRKHNFLNLHQIKVDTNSPRFPQMIDEVLASIRSQVRKIYAADRRAALFDALQFSAAPLLVLWLILTFAPEQIHPAALAVVGFFITLAAIPILFTWSTLKLIHDTRSREPDFNWYSAYCELLYCYLMSLGRASVVQVARVRIEAAVLNPAPKVPIPKDDAARQAAATIEYRNSRKERRKKLDKAATSALGIQRGQENLGIPPEFQCDTCFDLHHASEQLEGYLAVLRQRRGVRITTADRFLGHIRVQQGYLSPQYLTTGLMDEFDENWRPVLNWYGRAVEAPSPPVVTKRLQRVQVFEFLCWLTWGPSIPHCRCHRWTSQDPQKTGGLFLQFGYGDENNSFLVCDDESTSTPLKAFFEECLNKVPNARAFQCVATVRAELVSDVDRSLCQAQKVRQEQKDAGEQSGVVLRSVKIEPKMNDSRRIYQAYVWMMFVICDEQGRPLFTAEQSARDGQSAIPAEPWRALLPFFTHGNIAEPDTYEFIRREVAQKSLAAMRSLHQEAPHIKFRFAGASDESNCGESLVFAPAMPTMRGFFILETLSEEVALSAEDRACFILPGELQPNGEPYPDLASFRQTYSTCALPEMLHKFYESLAKEEGQVTPDAPSLKAVAVPHR